MHSIYYTEAEGGIISHSKINLSQEAQKRLCEAQSLDKLMPGNKVVITDGNIIIEASSVFFLDGMIWDAVLSGYDSLSMRRLYKHHKLHFLRNLK